MPQPLVGKHDIQMDPWAMLERPHVSSLISLVVNHYSGIEDHLFYLFQHLSAQKDGYPQAIYSALQSNNTRFDVTKGIFLLRFPQTSRTDLDRMFQRIRLSSSLRDKIVHCLWGVSDKFAEALVRIPLQNKENPNASSEIEVYGEKDFEDIINHITTTKRLLWEVLLLCHGATSDAMSIEIPDPNKLQPYAKGQKLATMSYSSGPITIGGDNVAEVLGSSLTPP